MYPTVFSVHSKSKEITDPSANQGEWEAAEALARNFEAHLKAHGVWDEKTLFVDDEWETAGSGPKKGWGEAIAANVVWAGQALAGRLGAHTERYGNFPTLNTL